MEISQMSTSHTNHEMQYFKDIVHYFRHSSCLMIPATRAKLLSCTVNETLSMHVCKTSCEPDVRGRLFRAENI